MSKTESSLSLEGSRVVELFIKSPELHLTTLIAHVPHERLNWQLADHYGVEVYVRRDDAIHPQLSGNKLYKLWGHYCYARASKNISGLASFGGAYSNHLYALAALGSLANIKTYGFVRGEEPTELSPTLIDLQAMGMTLIFVSRSDYNNKEDTDYLKMLNQRYCLSGNVHWIPEGGGGQLGRKGCVQLGAYLAKQEYKAIFQACGTAATLSGLTQGIESQGGVRPMAYGVSALRSNASTLRAVLASLKGHASNYMFSNQYHFGGFAKMKHKLACFQADFEEETGLMLDKVYTAKLAYAIADLIQKRHFKEGDKLLMIHSGGLQGNRTHRT